MVFEKIQLEPDEHVLTVARKHWFVLFQKTVGVILVTVLPLVGWLILSNLLAQIELQGEDAYLGNFGGHLFFLFILWMLFNWMTLAYAWTDHYLDIWAITDRRIIKVDQIGFFHRQIGSFRLEKLQDINTEVKGILATFLNYGTIVAQTAGGSHEQEFRVTHMPNPARLKSIILEATDKRMESGRERQLEA